MQCIYIRIYYEISAMVYKYFTGVPKVCVVHLFVDAVVENV